MALSYSSATAITMAMQAIATATYYGSASVDNTTNLYEDVLVGGFVSTGTSPTTGKRIQWFLYGTWDGGTTFSGGAAGTDAAYTPGGEAGNLIGPIWVIDTDATSNHVYEWGPVSLGAIIGAVPQKWGLVVTHDTAVNLKSLAGDHVQKYQGLKY